MPMPTTVSYRLQVVIWVPKYSWAFSLRSKRSKPFFVTSSIRSWRRIWYRLSFSSHSGIWIFSIFTGFSRIMIVEFRSICPRFRWTSLMYS